VPSIQQPFIARKVPSEGGRRQEAQVNAPRVQPSKPDAIIISAVSTCGGIDGIRTGNPFTALNVVSDNNTAFFIAHEPGTYGAAWDAQGTWTSTTVAFK
jgi:hypothetical protein